MKWPRADLLLLRWPALILAAAIALAVLLAAGSNASRSRLEQDFRQSELANSRARSELSEVRMQEANFLSFSDQFSRLEQRGLTGEERRLDWIDTVQRLRERYKLYTLEYEISAQQNFSALSSAPAGLNARASTLAIQLTALHEEDLLSFLDDLSKQAPGIFRQTRCNLTRLPGVADDYLAANINARCEYDWITLRVGGS